MKNHSTSIFTIIIHQDPLNLSFVELPHCKWRVIKMKDEIEKMFQCLHYNNDTTVLAIRFCVLTKWSIIYIHDLYFQWSDTSRLSALALKFSCSISLACWVVLQFIFNFNIPSNHYSYEMFKFYSILKETFFVLESHYSRVIVPYWRRFNMQGMHHTQSNIVLWENYHWQWIWLSGWIKEKIYYFFFLSLSEYVMLLIRLYGIIYHIYESEWVFVAKKKEL
jgi:hypothetical protein